MQCVYGDGCRRQHQRATVDIFMGDLRFLIFWHLMPICTIRRYDAPMGSRNDYDTIAVFQNWFVHVKSCIGFWLTRKTTLKQGGHGTGKTGNLVLTFSRQGKHREFCCNTGKVFETQGKYFWLYLLMQKACFSLHIFKIF